jgi:ATP-dependent helicase/nuclease subunit B
MFCDYIRVFLNKVADLPLMLPPLIDITLFKQAINDNQLIITPNHRLAAKITEAWGIHCQSTQRVWHSPRVFSIDHWLKFCWEELQDQNDEAISGKAIVGSQQNRYYWERSISENDPEVSSKYAKIASDTYTSIQQWNLAVEQIQDETPALVLFKRWVKSYKRLLARNSLITIPDSWQAIIKAFETSLFHQEKEILTYGFQSTPPLLKKLLNSASDQVRTIEAIPKETLGSVVSAEDPDHELRSAANWAAQKLKSNPDQRIGIVVPDLSNSLSKVARIVDEALRTHDVESLVNISAGTPLSQTSLVNSALGLIECLSVKKPLSEWLDLMYSPHNLLSEVPLQSKVNAELGLRKTRRFEHSFSEFCHVIMNEHETGSAPDILEPLAELRDGHTNFNREQQSFSQWAKSFSTYLTTLGWPGKRTLNSLEYQQKEHWHRLLQEFSELDNLGIEIGYTTALKHLRHLSKDAIFHPKTADAPLQLLGLLEASGLSFDSLWISGMDSQSFPASVAINPFLPAQFQRLQKMPHCLPERELEIARRLLLGYINSSCELFFSYSSTKGEEALQRSALLRDMPSIEVKDLIGNIAAFPHWLRQDNQTSLHEDKAPLFDQSIESISAGSALFKNQAACPFNAFAIHRLKAQPLEQPSHGLNGMDRGTILHETLFEVWDIWKSSAELQRLSEKSIANQLDTSASKVLDKWAMHHPILRGQHYRMIEKDRLTKLLIEWIEEEKKRPDFIIEDLEVKKTASFGNLDISLRIDRIDRIDEKLLIIDYKSGLINPSHWDGERPKDPQLPLYVSACRPPVNGCAFAQIKGGNIRFSGISDSQLLDSEKGSRSWSESVALWHESMEALASEFTAGIAQMEVIHPSGVIYQTHLLPLNRWPEEPMVNKSIESKALKPKVRSL